MAVATQLVGRVPVVNPGAAVPRIQVMLDGADVAINWML